ncbi:MAG: hypothetical protein KAW87_08305 [Candidatus Cloacimonetes bacterium]|nr:hypothetical protein [Candidatus Cloacimonadota bacterium]
MRIEDLTPKEMLAILEDNKEKLNKEEREEFQRLKFLFLFHSGTVEAFGDALYEFHEYFKDHKIENIKRSE